MPCEDNLEKPKYSYEDNLAKSKSTYMKKVFENSFIEVKNISIILLFKSLVFSIVICINK